MQDSEKAEAEGVTEDALSEWPGQTRLSLFREYHVIYDFTTTKLNFVTSIPINSNSSIKNPSIVLWKVTPIFHWNLTPPPQPSVSRSTSRKLRPSYTSHTHSFCSWYNLNRHTIISYHVAAATESVTVTAICILAGFRAHGQLKKASSF